MKRSTILTLICAGLSLAATDSPDLPKSPVAIAAIHKADNAAKQAADVYDKAMFNIKNTEQDELKVALKAATTKGDLAEANAIDALMKKIGAEFKKPYVPGLRVAPPNVVGKWVHGDVIFTITETTAKTNTLPESEAKLTGNVMTIDFKGWYTRLTFEGDRAFEESWPPGHSQSEAPILSIAVRQK